MKDKQMHKTNAIIRVNISRTDTRDPIQYRMIEDVYKQLRQDFLAYLTSGRTHPAQGSYTVLDADEPITVQLNLTFGPVRSVEKVT